MADNVTITSGTGDTIAADQVTDGVLGTVKVQYVKIMDGTIDGTGKAVVGANGLVVQPGANFGVQVIGGGVSGDQTVKPSTTNFNKFPVSGDTRMMDGVDPSVKATVRNYTSAKPVAVSPTNTSGDAYGDPTPALLQFVAGRITAAASGSNQIVAGLAGRRIKVVGYSLQGDGDTARGYFAAGASGSPLTLEWELGSREGVVRQVDGGRSRGFLFATPPGTALSFESSAGRAMKYDVTYHVEDAS